MNPIKYLTTLALAGLLSSAAGAEEKPTLKDLVQQETNIVENETKDVQKLLQTASACDGVHFQELRLDANGISCHQCRPEKGRDYPCSQGDEYTCPDYSATGYEFPIDFPCSVYPDIILHQYSLADIDGLKAQQETIIVHLESHGVDNKEHTYTFPTRGAAAAMVGELRALAIDYSSLAVLSSISTDEKPNNLEQEIKDADSLFGLSSPCEFLSGINTDGKLHCTICGPENGMDYCAPGGTDYSYSLCDITNVSSVLLPPSMDVTVASKKYTYTFPDATVAAAAAIKLETLVNHYKANMCKHD